ncbi:hypothetical protein BBJ28_00023566 [Nothophytophthora sp. Chile5]|nr:hypothetical protein BBJ28_00023566 [Nothophytophthora sp. Chile5]
MPAFQQQSIVDFTTAESASATQQQLLAAHNGRGFCDEAVVTVLEAYLAEQVQNSTVDIDADLALLKLYLVYPATADADQVAKVLVKGIMAMPSTFFTGVTTMLPENIREVLNPRFFAVVSPLGRQRDGSAEHGLPAAVVLVRGSSLLAALVSCPVSSDAKRCVPSTFDAESQDFWKEDVTYATTVPGFLESVRAFILDAIRRSHSAIATDVFKAKLNVSDKEVAEIVAGTQTITVDPLMDVWQAEKWTVAGDVIQISANEDNQMQAKKIQENIEFQDVLKVIHTLSR